MDTAPNYLSYIFNPMDLTTLERNIQNKMYGSPDAFLADVKWIAHNCVIYNGSSNKLTKSAQLISQIAEHEIKEMQLCPDCYRFSCSKKKNWFCEPCRNLHTLVWAKLKGFPFWPAKVLQEHDNRLDVRFFGQHDSSGLLSHLQTDAFSSTNNKTSGLSQAVREVEIHMQKIVIRIVNVTTRPSELRTTCQNVHPEEYASNKKRDRNCEQRQEEKEEREGDLCPSVKRFGPPKPVQPSM
ncbi:hypothetical protein BSL78_17840 [Apostichopus japonicus]|uniref:Protein kinase C-binding protein 1 n=1 Tax=Stichopus japonicus TaxID=307972 RepID=A0A2G8KBF2_STIJA|nr:hypothetical protein BSL78_17840 [Apostichopus japonicus]